MFDLEKETPEEVGEAEIPAGPNVIPNTPDNTNQQGAQTADAEDDDQAGDQGDGNQQPELIPPDPIDIDVADAQEDVGTPIAAPTPVAMDRGGLRREVRALQIDPTSTFVPAEAGEDGMVTRQQAGNIIDDDSYLVHDHTALTASLTSDPIIDDVPSLLSCEHTILSSFCWHKCACGINLECSYFPSECSSPIHGYWSWGCNRCSNILLCIILAEAGENGMLT